MAFAGDVATLIAALGLALLVRSLPADRWAFARSSMASHLEQPNGIDPEVQIFVFTFG